MIITLPIFKTWSLFNFGSITGVIYTWYAKMDCYPFHSLASYVFFSTWLHALAYKHFEPIYSPLYSGLPDLLHVLVGLLGQVQESSQLLLLTNATQHLSSMWWFHSKARSIPEEGGGQKKRNIKWEEEKGRRISCLTYGATAYHLLTCLLMIFSFWRS